MYEDRLGTDWEDISGDEAIRRAYALGVAAAFGYENREEFDRLREALDTSYDRSIIDLAYQEGKQEAEVVRAENDAAPSGEEVWRHLVDGAVPHYREDDADGDEVGRTPADRPISATDLPPALDRTDVLDGGKDLGALGFPELLGSSPSSDDETES